MTTFNYALRPTWLRFETRLIRRWAVGDWSYHALHVAINCIARRTGRIYSLRRSRGGLIQVVRPSGEVLWKAGRPGTTLRRLAMAATSAEWITKERLGQLPEQQTEKRFTDAEWERLPYRTKLCINGGLVDEGAMVKEWRAKWAEEQACADREALADSEAATGRQHNGT